MSWNPKARWGWDVLLIIGQTIGVAIGTVLAIIIMRLAGL